MADLFTVTAPLLIRHPAGERRVMAEVFPHPRGLLYFVPFWDRLPLEHAVHLVEGKIRGEGPWKAGECVITLLGCQGAHPEQREEFAAWQCYLEHDEDWLALHSRLESIALDLGALTGS